MTSTISCDFPNPVYIYNGGVSSLYLCCQMQDNNNNINTNINIINGGIANIYSCYRNSSDSSSPSPTSDSPILSSSSLQPFPSSTPSPPLHNTGFKNFYSYCLILIIFPFILLNNL